MKRRIINGLLALALLLPVTGGFTSCKDTDEDQFNNLKKEQYELETKIQDLNKALDDLKQLQEACKGECEKTMELMLAKYVLKKDFDDYKIEAANTYATLQQFAALQGTVNVINQTINTINQTLNTYGNKISTLEQKADAADVAISQINTTLVTVQQTISGLQSTVATLGTDLNNLSNKVGNIEITVNNQQTTINNLQTTVNELTTNLTTLTGTVTSMQQQIAPIIADWSVVKQNAMDAWSWVNTNQALVSSMNTTLNDLTTNKIPGMEQDITDLKSDLAGVTTHLETLTANMRDIDGVINGKGGILDCIAIHDTQIKQLRSDLEALMTRFTDLENRLNSLVTGIILQGTVNPVFGTMSLPINVQSNILMAYYGYNDYGREYKFPTDRPDPEFDNSIVITDEDWEMLTLTGSDIKEYFTVEQGPILDTEAGNAGRVYVTVNPNNVNFEGVTLPIVNSRDEESGITLTPLKKSDAELKFGYSRSEVKNGFYEADATLKAEDIEKVKVDIEPGLKSAMKDVLTDRSKKDFAVLLKKVYDQFNGILPANGLKAGWTVNDQPFAVYSQYNLAATAFKPLSFKFLQGQTLRQLPTITPLTGFDFDLSKFNFTIEMPDFTIDTDDMTFSLNLTFDSIDVTYDGELEVTVKIPDYPVIVDGKFTGETVEKVITAKAEGLDDLLQSINDSLKSALQSNADRWNEKIEAQFKKAMEDFASKVQAQVDDMMDKVAGQINDKIKDMLNQIGDEVNDKIGSYINKANSLINKYNSAADRINEYIKNANNYLQVTMLLQSADGMLHNVSNSAAMPSRFVLNGGDALTLYLTTYTGEIVVPCLKKYVGVTNVFKGAASAQAGDADCLAQLKAANATEFMNTALSGDQRRVAFSGKSGYVYELVYQALDYHGYTSTRKFYVEVK